MQLNYKRTVLIGFAFMAILAFWQFYDQVIPYLLEVKFGRDVFESKVFMAMDNVLAVFMLPLFGKLSDKTHTRLGKRTPYILYGTIASVILLCVLAYFERVSDFWGFIVVLMLLLIAMATYRSPAVAYMPDVTEKPLRSKGNAIINLVGYIGGIFATILMMFMLKGGEKYVENGEIKIKYPESLSFTPVFLIIAAFMLVAVLIMVLTVKENKVLAETNVKDEEETVVAGAKTKLSKPVLCSLILILLSVLLWYIAYNGVTTSFSMYCFNIWGIDLGTSSMYLTVATVAAIAAFVPLGLLSSKIGRKKAVLFGIVLMTVCYTVAIFVSADVVTKAPWLMYVMFGIIGIGWASINVNSFPMVVEMCTGSDVGKYTGYYYTFSMAAQIITPLLSGWLIKTLPMGYKILFPYAVVFSAASFITMCFVRHGDSRPNRKKAIEEQFAADN